MLNDVNSREVGGAVSMRSRSIVVSCAQILATSCPQVLVTARLFYLLESAEMTTQESPERLQVDKDVVKEALREILNEIPSFRTMVQRGRDNATPREDGAQTDASDGTTAQNGPPGKV